MQKGWIPPVLFTGAVTLLSDTFTDTNGTGLAAHTIAPINSPATSWTEAINNFEITSNRALVVVDTQTLAFLETGISNGTVSAVANGAAGQVLGIIFRYTDANNYFVLQIDVTGDTLRLYENASASLTLRDSEAVTIAAATDYTLRAVFNGTSITGTVNGGSTVTYTSSANQTATKCGIRHTGDGTGTNVFDDFTVTTSTGLS